MFVWNRWPMYFRGLARVRYQLAREGLAVSPYWTLATVVLDFGEELRERQLQALCNPRDVVEGNIRLATLNRTHEGAVNADGIREAFLRESALRSKPANGLPEPLPR